MHPSTIKSISLPETQTRYLWVYAHKKPSKEVPKGGHCDPYICRLLTDKSYIKVLQNTRHKIVTTG
jgi:hypothetical protein